jgi:hypothetical protein
MNEIETLLEQARLFAVQHAPAEALKGAIPAALVMLMAGIGLSVLGAKLAKFALTAGFVVVGGALGSWFAREFAFQPLVCVIVGGLLVGLIAYQTFRLWVGVAAALVFSSFVLGTFGYQRVVPYVSQFEQQQVSVESPIQFALPSPAEQEAYRSRTPRQWASEFWSFLKQQDATVARNTKALAIVAMLTGLCLGILAARWALILSTSLIGTALVTTAMATLLTKSVPASYQAFQNNPGLAGIGIGGFLVTSLVLQTMLSRKSPSKAETSST